MHKFISMRQPEIRKIERVHEVMFTIMCSCAEYSLSLSIALCMCVCVSLLKNIKASMRYYARIYLYVLKSIISL